MPDNHDFAHSPDSPPATTDTWRDVSKQPPVGRAAEIARLERAVHWLRSGHGTVLELAGDPGLGKSTLLSVLAGLAARAGIRLARGHAGRGNAAPGQVFRDAWGDHPALDPRDVDGDRFLQAARGLALDWASGAGGALLLDDAQWCDSGSVELVRRLIRRPVPGPFLLALAHRPRQTSPILLAALDEGVRAGTVTRIAVPPLGPDAVRELLARWSADSGPEHEDHLDRLRDAAGGSPRSLRILLAAGWDPGRSPGRGDDPGLLLREAAALTAEFEAVSPQARAALGAAAVLGTPFRPQDVAPVCGLDPDHAFAALGELTRADLVRGRGEGGTLGFRDSVLEQVAHEHMDLLERSTAHRRALDLLTEQGGTAAQLARHAVHLLGTDSAVAAPVLARAAAEALAHRPDAAARWLRLALDHTPHGAAGKEARSELEVLRSRALIGAGRLDEARTLIHEVLGRSDELPWQLAVRAAGAAADVERLLCRHEEAEAIAAAALRRLPAPGNGGPLPLEAAAMTYEYALVQSMRGDHVRARATLRPALGSALEPAHPTGVAIRCLAACQDAYLGDVAEAVRAVRECADSTDALPDPQAGRSPEMFLTLGTAEFYLERFDAAARHFGRFLKVPGARAQQHLASYQLVGLAVVDLCGGRLAQAARRAAEAERSATDIGSQEITGLARAARAAALAWTRGRRDTREALALADSALLDLAARDSWWCLSAIGLAAQVRLVAGDPDGALRTMVDGAGGEDVAQLQPALEPSLRALMASAALNCGDLVSARHWTAQAEAAAQRLGLPGQRAWAVRARAALHLTDGQPDLAAPLFEQAAEGFQRAGLPLQRAWTLVSGAQAAGAAQGRDVALGWLDSASVIADALGALRVREEAARVRAELAGSRSERDPAQPPAAGPLAVLSDREREIAALAAAGLRSREIAQRLFLSPRTVDAHLGRVYRRLGLSSRAELARVIGGRDGAVG
ncbi:helix-turn-helix transcriptional regulator [Kitasatospora viridis]|uniref:AAA ATPase-like protein n=1 Tax=Kitasatospora viridis TaxID=281105 RepID=A0A561TSB5_9ACTN|nr:LuxR family transcriptional regulator [Kitasatospora viridis]TWF90005.1 AAA ATPase-like protein [Kitasatospora viridis]